MSLSNFCCTLLKFYSQSFSGAHCLTCVDLTAQLLPGARGGGQVFLGGVATLPLAGMMPAPVTAGHVVIGRGAGLNTGVFPP